MPSLKKRQNRRTQVRSASTRTRSRSGSVTIKKRASSIKRSKSRDRSNAPLTGDKLDEALLKRLMELMAEVRTIYTECIESGASSTQCKSHALRRITNYLDVLQSEAQTQVTLQSKALQGQKLDTEELKTLDALQYKCETIRSDTNALEEARLSARLASEKQQSLEAFVELTGDEPSARQRTMLVQAQMQSRTALERAKQTLLKLLDQTWVIPTILAVSLASTAAWTTHSAFLSAASASTTLLHEANQMAHTIEAATEMLQTGSREASKWTIGSLGGAVGAANGFILSSLLPKSGPAGRTAASVLGSAAMGLFAGLSLL